MRKLQLTYKPLLLLLLLMAFPALAQQFAEQSTYEGRYEATDGMTLEVNNKYGNIQFVNWEKDSIHITTEVFISASSYKKLEKLKKNINIKYTASKQHILAETTYSSNSIQFIDDVQTFTEDLVATNTKRIDINYLIYLPEDINIKVNSQYGDVLMENNSKKVNISLSNGAFKAGTLTGSARFDFRFVQSTVERVNDAEFNMHYSKLDLTKAISLNCNSRSSDIIIDEVGVLKLKSNRDDIRLDKVGYLYGSANYPKMKINNLTNEMDCETSYGTIVIEDIASSCSMIKLYTERTDVEIFIPKIQDFSYDMIYHPDGSVHLPIKAASQSTTLNGEVMQTLQGQTADKTTLTINIKALKRSIIKIQYSLRRIA